MLILYSAIEKLEVSIKAVAINILHFFFHFTPIIITITYFLC
jgi:hypothetical protein